MRFLRPTKFFREKSLQPLFREPCPLSLYKKSEKSNDSILHKVQKTLFLGSFWPKFAQKKFFSKNRLRHILGIAILHHCAKNQKKLMSRSREKLVTDGRTDGRTRVNLKDYLKVGPKTLNLMNSIKNKNQLWLCMCSITC